MFKILVLTAILAIGISAKADEPQISIYKATEKGYSVLVLEWPDKSVDRLVYKDTNKEVIDKWFNDRLNEKETNSKP